MKNLDSYCFVTSLWLFSLENYVNVPSKSNKQKNLFKNIVFLLASWRSVTKIPDPLVRGMDPRIRILTKMSRIHYTGQNVRILTRKDNSEIRPVEDVPDSTGFGSWTRGVSFMYSTQVPVCVADPPSSWFFLLLKFQIQSRSQRALFSLIRKEYS
jgi:hypothetical protein